MKLLEASPAVGGYEYANNLEAGLLFVLRDW